jgi:glutamine amidotransferase
VAKFDSTEVRIPHIGWNVVEATRPNQLVSENDYPQKFYFSHSFFVHSENASISTLKTTYGQNFTSGFEMGNILGVQFHPEKSQTNGLILLQNFMEI